VAACREQSACSGETSDRAGTTARPNFLGRFSIGHTAPRTACCSSLQKQPPDRIGRRLAFTLQKCQDKSSVGNCSAVENFFT
jgi:hypothetical protein